MAQEPQIDSPEPPDLAAFATFLAKEGGKTFGIGGVMSWIINNGTDLLVVIVGTALRGMTRMATLIAKGLQTVLEQDNPELGRLAVTILGTMFGTSVADSMPGDLMHPGNLDDNSQVVGAAILNTVFGAVLDGGSIEPSLGRAEKYLGSITNMVTRGFIVDMITEVMPSDLWRIEAPFHLEEELINGLGLGRIARTVMQPIVTALISEPALWAINLAYRPKRLPENVAVLQWARGRLDDAQLDDELGRQGWSAERIEAFKNAFTKLLGVDDLLVLVDHGSLDEEEAINLLTMQGYEDATARQLVDVTRLKKLHALVQREADVWLAKYESGLISQSTFRSSLATLDLTDDIQQAYLNIGGARREVPSKLLSPGELKDAWNKAIIDQGEYHDYLVRLGYSEDDVTTLVLLNIATIRDKEEAAQAKLKVQAERAAQLAQQKADKAAAAAAAKADAAAQRAQHAADLAAQRAQATADAEARRQFVANAALQKRALVDAQHQQGLLETDLATIAKAQIDADEKELLATAAGQDAAARASFERQILELRQADREATLQQQLDDIDLSLEPAKKVRDADVAARLAEVSAVLTRKLHDQATLYAARARTIDDDLAAALAAVDVAQLPTMTERAAVVAQQIDALDAALVRQLTDIRARASAKHADIDRQLDAGEVKAPIADKDHHLEALAQANAERLAQQQHDVSRVRLQDVADQIEPLAAAAADRTKTALQAQAAAARKKLAADQLAADLAARQSADAETLRLHTVAAQIAPLTAAEAERRRLAIVAANAAATRQEAVTAAEIAKGEASAQAAAQRAQTTVSALQQRLTAVRAAAGTREDAQAAAIAAQLALETQIERDRQQLEATIAAHHVGGGPPIVRAA